jgi:hypothetical protein
VEAFISAVGRSGERRARIDGKIIITGKDWSLWSGFAYKLAAMNIHDVLAGGCCAKMQFNS